MTTRLTVVILYTITFFSTILLEIWFRQSSSSSSNITLLDHIQASFIPKMLIIGTLIGSIIFISFMGLVMKISIHGKLVIYITLARFVESLPPLIDLINLLFIYHKTFNPSNRLNLSLIFALIRIILNLNVVRGGCNSKSKRQIIVVCDLLFYILISVSLIHYSNRNLIRIGRKLILGILMVQLNNLVHNKTFWNENLRSLPSQFALKSIHLMLVIRWILSLVISYLFTFYTLQSIIIDDYKSFFSIRFFKSCGLILGMCLISFQDLLQNRKTLNQYGISRYCTGIDRLLRGKSTKTLVNTDNVIPDRLPTIKNNQQICAVCCNEKDLIDFALPFKDNCRHLNRTVCRTCLVNHVEIGFQITFTDDILCPEPECGVKLDYDTVKNILLLISNNNLVERYDRYVLYRQLEQMDEWIWCSNPLCNIGQLNAGGALNNIVTCMNCRQKTCFIHKAKWHEGLTCEEYDMNIDQKNESSRRWIVENSKKCPNCPYQIEKSDGCDHMTCIKCHHQFCWSCLADFQPIRQHGNHRHNPTCKHYVEYDEE